MNFSSSQNDGLEINVDSETGGELLLRVTGRLDSYTASDVWKPLTRFVHRRKSPLVRVDASALDYLDGVGAGLFLELEKDQMSRGAEFVLESLPEQLAPVHRMFYSRSLLDPPVKIERPMIVLDSLGRGAIEFWEATKETIEFIGGVGLALAGAFLMPHRIRWRDVLRVMDSAGAAAVPIVGLMGFLMGLIMAFQSAIPMQRFGVEIFVADMISLAMFRELGPLMSSIILAGRTSSAFAAEIGTM